MTKDILDEFNPDSSPGRRATNGGQQSVRDVNNYSPPKGPKNINDAKSPGIHGDNCGTCGTQGKH